MMCVNKKGWIGLVVALIAVAAIYYLMRPQPITIESTQPQSSYRLCCVGVDEQVVCSDDAGTVLALEFVDLPEASSLSACAVDNKPENKADFSRHQILSPADLMAVSRCCLQADHQKRCQLLNGHSFTMPLARGEGQPPACKK